MTLTLQITAVAALLIVGGLSTLAIAARGFDRRYSRPERPSNSD